jgi:sugar/nucleoside kinase (ribokinase family)
LILVTPDAQRTMNTFLGASAQLTEDDIDEALIARAHITYLEGYLFDPPAAKRAFAKAASTAHASGRKVSLTLSDTFCVERHREEFQDLVANHVDILFANENEAKALYRKDSFDDAIAAVRGNCEMVCVTRSEKGSVILAGDQVHEIPAERAERLVDTTGAGDLYAAGVLYGVTQGRPLPDCGRIGSIAAAEVISHVGARPTAKLADLVAARMGGY